MGGGVMGWVFEPFEYEFMRRALMGCVLVGFTNGFLGAFVVVRRLALVADALSHSLLPGLALAAILVGLTPGGLLLGGLLAALFVVLGGHMISRSSRVKEETAIAALGTGGAVAGLMASYWANIPSGPAIVLILGAAFVLAYLFGPKHGIVARRARRHLHEESLRRWDKA
jgi:ABC-type Mn2+/Zn2+ transport system permease subunit